MHARKNLLFFFTFLLSFSVQSQISKGSNYLFFGNFQNDYKSIAKNYPIDTTVVDSSGSVGAKANISASLLIGYQYAVTNRFSLGFLTLLQSQKESTYKIGAIGPSFRYHFGFDFLSKPKKVRIKSGLTEDQKQAKRSQALSRPKFFHYFTPADSETRLKSLFFVEGSALFGSIRAVGIVSPYSHYSIMGGVLFRFPKPDIRFVRNAGIEFSIGARRVTNLQAQNEITFATKAGLVFFLDRKYTRLRSQKRGFEFLEK